MGFMDKAKQLAEQAQQKLDEAQKQFNEGQASKAGQPEGGKRYDQHGRSVDEPPAGSAPPPSAEPADAPPDAEETVNEEPVAEQPPSKPAADTNANPDPFKPIQ